MSDEPPPSDEEARRPPPEAVASTIDCIEQDFRRLAETLARMLDILAGSDLDLSERISSMKDVADRGLVLSRELMNLLRKHD